MSYGPTWGRKDNEYWVAYAIDRRTGMVVDFVVGKRTKATLKELIERLLLLNTGIIRTDKLTLYEHLIPKQLHRRGAANGKAFEAVTKKGLVDAGHTDIAEQVTVKADNGVKTRVDFISKDSQGKVALTEAKASQTAPLTKNQTAAHPSIEQRGGTVVGKGKPGYVGGTKIPPTKVNVVRKPNN